MSIFITSTYEYLLNHHQLNTFAKVWALQADWFEPPNHKRNGWSGVCKLLLSEEFVFLKRQHHHARRTWLKPIQGESTLRREFQILQHLQKNKVNAPELIMFGEQINSGKIDAVLMMKALSGYESFEDYCKTQPMSQALTVSIGRAISRLHQSGIQHRSLYPKHIFIKKTAENFEVAMIDFEKSRFTALPRIRGFSDICTLFKRTSEIAGFDQLTFFKAYYGLDIDNQPLNFRYRVLWFIMQKSIC